jgi:hypothetical protein
MMLHYEGIGNLHNEAKKQHEGFIGWPGVVEALTCAAINVSEGFNNSMSKQVGKFHSRGVDVVVEGDEGFNGRNRDARTFHDGSNGAALARPYRVYNWPIPQ